MLLRWPHLSFAATTNWSITTCAALAKSPNRASTAPSAVRRDRVAVFEPERRVLREHGVVEHERRLVVGQVCKRHVLGFGALVDEHAVTLAERAAAGVLTGQPHGSAVQHQGPEGQGLGQRPVDLVALHHGARGASSWRSSLGFTVKSSGQCVRPSSTDAARGRDPGRDRWIGARVVVSTRDREPGVVVLVCGIGDAAGLRLLERAGRAAP